MQTVLDGKLRHEVADEGVALQRGDVTPHDGVDLAQERLDERVQTPDLGTKTKIELTLFDFITSISLPPEGWRSPG